MVVTDGNPYAHLNPGERLYIVPNMTVQEPVPLEDYERLVKIVENHIKGA